MSKSDAMLEGLSRLNLAAVANLQPGWFDVIEAALAEQGYYLAPIVPAETVGARTSDPRTSHQAVPSKMRANSQRHRLLKAYANPALRVKHSGQWLGLTDEEAAAMAEGVRHDSEYATRCSELRNAGLIRDTGEDRKGATGTPRIVCRITDMGLAELRRLG